MSRAKEAARFASIPDELKADESWVLWNYEYDRGKPTKVLRQANGRHADSTKPETWTDFEAVVEAYKGGGFDGIGFVFHPDNPFAGADLDDVTEEQALRWIDSFDSYTERSPSGNGLHIICRAEVPKGTNRDEGELYSAGRFFTVTGNVVRDAPVREAQDAADEFYRFLRRRDDAPIERAATTPTLTDAEVVHLAEDARNGTEFSIVYRGGGQFKSASERDLSLASRLAFWTQDASQVERIMRGSGCFREKWDKHRTYLRDTIEKALSSVSETYTPLGERPHITVGGKALRSEDGEEDPQRPRSRFERIDLGEPIESGMEPAEMLVPDVLYAGSVHGIYSAGGKGKTFFALWLIKQVIVQDRPVMLLDQENGVRIISERLRALGVSAEQARRNLYYYPFPSMPLEAGAADEFEEMLDEVKPALVVFDSWINFLASAGLDENSSVDIAQWADAYSQKARQRGMAILLLDHIPKEGNTARGSGRKLDYVDVMWELTKPQDFDRETVGRINLRLKKDREGWMPWGVAFTVGGSENGLVFGRTAFDSSLLAPDRLLPSDRTTLDALKSFGSSGVRDKDWREEAIKRGLGRTTYYRSRGTLLEHGLVEEVMGKYFCKTPAKPESHLVPQESHGTSGTTANCGRSQESHHPKGWDHGTNQAETSHRDPEAWKERY
jgi:AAA domain